MKQLFFFLLFGLLYATNILAFDMNDFDKHFKLLPQPQKIELVNSKGISSTSLQSIYLKGITSKPVLYGSLKSLPLTNKSAGGVLELKLSAGSELPQSIEGYIIEIKDESVTITARDEAGLFYGCVTLSQLLDDAHDESIAIPACKITDYPDITYRAIHLDL